MILSSLKYRILILATVPVIFTTIVLAGFFIRSQILNTELELKSHGEITASYLARACEYGVFAGNPDILRPIVISTLEENSVIGVTITDRQGDILIQENKPASVANEATSVSSDEILSFSHAITQFPIEIDDLSSPKTFDIESVEPLGWVIVKLSSTEANIRLHTTINNTLIITATGIFLSILLAALFGGRLTSPLLRLTTTVRNIEDGNLDIVIDNSSTGEIGTLEAGVSGMLQSLRDSRDNLRKQVEKATTDLRHSLQVVEQQNDELRKARQDALSANTAKSAFLANVSHEIRTPLNGILGFIKLLKKTGLKREQEDYAETIEKSAENLLHLIEDIIDISRIESGKLSIQYVKFDLKECIEDIVTLLAPSAYDKSLDLISIFYDDVPQNLFGAPDRIRQILINLIGNAIKFSHQGTVIIRASLEDEGNDDLIIRISVTDQGIGISQQDKEILFNSFSQLDSSTTRRYGGAGLGLSISKSLAEMMGGTIDVNSSEDKGSTFWFTFKARKVDDHVPSTETTYLLHHDICALLYDENYYSCISLMHLLRRLGISVTTCRTLDDFSRRISESTHFDIVVIGLTKSDFTPDRLRLIAATIRKHSGAKALCLINSIDPITLLQIREHGFDTCIPKASRSKDIFENIRILLSGSHHIGTDQISPVDTAPSPSTSIHKLNSPFDLSLSMANILIAEDNDINSKLLCTILDQAGASTILVQDGKRAVEMFTQHSFDIILMDVHMPEKNGVQATAEIRELENSQERIPIIGLTASVLANERRMYLNAGMDDLLVKPVAIEKLLQTIHFWIYDRKAQNSKDSSSKESFTPSPVVIPANRNNLADGKKLTRTLFEMLIDEIPVTRGKFQQAYDEEDWEKLAELVHKLLGGLGYCDVPALKSAVEYLQNQLSPATEALPKALDNVFNEMQWLLDRYSGQDG